MGFLISPKVLVTEIDLTAGIQAVATTEAAFAGLFTWGPLNKRTLISTEKKLVDLFGEPDSNTYEHFFSASNFLSYSNAIHVVRVAKETQTSTTLSNKITTTSASTTVSISHTSHGAVTGDIVTIAGLAVAVDTIPAAQINGKHVITRIDANTYTFTVTTAGSAGVVSAGGTITAAFGDYAQNATTEKYTSAGGVGEGILIKNEDHYEETYSLGGADVGLWAAKYPGTHGNTLKVSMCPSETAYSRTLTGTLSVAQGGVTVTGSGTAFTTQVVAGSILIHPTTGEELSVASVESTTSLTLLEGPTAAISAGTVVVKWEYYTEFGVAPGTSQYAAARGCLNDEVHIIVIDEDGLETGIRGQVLERYSFVSLRADAKTEQNETNYYKNVINKKSKFLWWMDHLAAGTNWGSNTDGITYTNVTIPSTFSLAGGLDGNTTAVDADLERGFDFFISPDEVDISIIITGPASATLKEYVVQNICEVRRDCVACISPTKVCVVDNADDEIDDITSHFSPISASSYAIVDTNWGLQYDRYNDVNRWVPLNGDIAGLIARVDDLRDPWFSPAGTTFGHIKNKLKLAWTQDESDRDALYQLGMNPIRIKKGQGVLLWGDKTYLNRPSVFGYINVRRLFIVLEKAIASASEVFLFYLNTDVTRSQFVNLVEPFLREVKGRQGLYDFKVICDESNNTPEVIDEHTMVGDIYLKPTISINYIKLNFIAVRTGVRFEEVVLGQTLQTSL